MRRIQVDGEFSGDKAPRSPHVEAFSPDNCIVTMRDTRIDTRQDPHHRAAPHGSVQLVAAPLRDEAVACECVTLELKELGEPWGAVRGVKKGSHAIRRALATGSGGDELHICG